MEAHSEMYFENENMFMEKKPFLKKLQLANSIKKSPVCFFLILNLRIDEIGLSF